MVLRSRHEKTLLAQLWQLKTEQDGTALLYSHLRRPSAQTRLRIVYIRPYLDTNISEINFVLVFSHTKAYRTKVHLIRFVSLQGILLG